MGPTLILDKSTFQSLSAHEHLELSRWFYQNMTSVLAMELLGDIAKAFKSGRSPEMRVAEMASKFGGSGPVTNENCGFMCIQSLLGEFVGSGPIVLEI